MSHPSTPRARLLVVPGLHGSGPAHWQTWLEAHWRDAVRVRQADWSRPDIDRWSHRIGQTLQSDPHARWVAVAHSFGTLALAHHLAHRPAGAHGGIAAVLLVAPAEPSRFGVEAVLPHGRLGVPGVLVASRSDPWMTYERAAHWSARWGTHLWDCGDVGHINVDSGHGPFPPALRLTRALMRRVAGRRSPAAVDAAAPSPLRRALRVAHAEPSTNYA